MSIANSRNVNGHATKRRKTSHDSDEPPFKATVFSGESKDGVNSSEASEEGDGEAITAISSSSSGLKSQKPQKSNAIKTTNTSSSTLMLQAQRLLDETRPDHSSRIKRLTPTADRIITVIKELSEQKPMSYAQAQSYSQKTLRVTIPWSHRPAIDVKYNFHFVPPTNVTLQGPLMHHLTLHDSSSIIVVAPEMPSQIFQDKDYLNYRCLHKRAFFLACIAAALREELAHEFDLVFAFPQDNTLSAVLQLVAKHDGKVVYEIDPAFPETLGPVTKMTPMHTCIRKHDLANNNITNDLSENTPFYNSTVRSLSSIDQFQRLIRDATTRADSFRDACLLAAIWLRERKFSSAISQGGFGVEEWSLICALLLNSGGHQAQPLFSPRYSAVQFFKAMLQVLSSRDMYDAFIVRGTIKVGEQSSIPVLLDATAGVNVLYKMTPWSYARLKHLATLSLAALNSRKSNGFDATFMTTASDPALQYDELYHFEGLSLSGSSSDIVQQQSKLHTLLARGLSDRVSLINIAGRALPPWKVTSSTPQSAASPHTVGLIVNADNATRLVDHGPSVEEKEASQAFRSFWGEKAELRKFKDGRICESLVWTADIPVTQQIIHYICQQHLGLSPSSIRGTPPIEHIRLRSSVAAEDAFAMVTNKFQALSSTLHHLDGLPLPIRSVTAASELTRSSSLISPLEPGVSQPIDVVVQFDSSGRWPDNSQAIQYTKIAFLTKIGDLLAKQDRKLEVRVGVENTSIVTSGIFNTSYLDVISPPSAPSLSPIVFRLRIYHEREMQLLQQALSDKALRPHDRERLQSALQYLKQNFVSQPSHNTAIHSLLTQFSPLSTTIRLLKSWISAHHLSQHIPCEVLEVIAAHVFLAPAPWSTPGTPTLAFTRCLHFLSQWDWSSQPLITDLSPSQDMTLESRNELETRFAAWRQMDPNMNTVTWFVGTNLDTTGLIWTQGVGGQGSRPPRVIASRLTALARAAMNLIKSKSDATTQIMTTSDWKEIFTSPLNDFDFTIHLKPSILRETKKPKKAQFKNLQLTASLDVDTTGVDFIQSYIEDLTSSFGKAALFFYGAKYSGSDVIGGLWRPNLRGKDAKPWKIRLGYSTVPVKMHHEDASDTSEGICKVNFEGMLAEMGMMGEGLVEKISIKES